MDCYKGLNFDERAIDDSFAILTGILNLGNVQFESKNFGEGNDGAIIKESSKEAANLAC